MAKPDIVIADFHHASLFHSLMYLFDERLGFDLRRPFGLDWWKEGYFSYCNPDFGQGILQTESKIKELDPDKIDTTVEPMGKTITLPEAKDNAGKIRFMVSSLHDSEPCFNAFIRDFCSFKKTVLIRQVGNPNEVVRCSSHALCSDKQTFDRLAGGAKHYHRILYHQEFNRNIFDWHNVNYPRRRQPKHIKSYLNFIKSNVPIYSQYCNLRNYIENVRWYEHGLQGEHGEFHSLAKMADSMADADMGISMKHWDGFGHCVHNLAAIGRPIISRIGDYDEKLGGLFMEDGVTAVKLTGNLEVDKKKILRMLEPDNLVAACWETYKRFCENVNFDEEEVSIRKWLSEI